MIRVLLSLMIVAFAVTTAQRARAISLVDFQALLPAGDTYVDLDGTNAPEAVASWGFPDGSDAGVTVDGNIADDKQDAGGDPLEIAMTLGGLAANTAYNIDVVVVGRSEFVQGETNSFDVAGGFVSGSLTTYVVSDTANDGTLVSGAATSGLFRIPLGAGTSNGSGDLVVYLGSVDGSTGGGVGTVRTEIDGLIYSVVPEPSTALLAAIGLVGLLFRGKCRRI